MNNRVHNARMGIMASCARLCAAMAAAALIAAATPASAATQSAAVASAAKVSVKATVSPRAYTGSGCPKTFVFTGKIHVSRGPIRVRYTWIRSDGATSPVKTIRFTARQPRTRTVKTTWTLGANGTYWQALQILSPRHVRSPRATFTLTCLPSTPMASASTSVYPTSYSGPQCPKVFTFTGRIHVSAGPATVSYRWLRSDGVPSAPDKLVFTGNGPQDQFVHDTWTISANGTNWEAIEILSPNAAQSNHATFTLDCQV
jgi:hypothetical protein